jgi:hypothetical protein
MRRRRRPVALPVKLSRSEQCMVNVLVALTMLLLFVVVAYLAAHP